MTDYCYAIVVDSEYGLREVVYDYAEAKKHGYADAVEVDYLASGKRNFDLYGCLTKYQDICKRFGEIYVDTTEQGQKNNPDDTAKIVVGPFRMADGEDLFNMAVFIGSRMTGERRL